MEQTFLLIFICLCTTVQSKLNGLQYHAFRAKLPLDSYTAPGTLRHNLYSHWGFRGTDSSKHPKQMFFSSVMLKESSVFPRCDLKSFFSESKIYLARAKKMMCVEITETGTVLFLLPVWSDL